ncbi:type 1 glutamine amidotransferase [Prochlorococcus sp. MIT 1341]|uniref:type 1 glutamine amidotransferase n=1 Tax=Prochlorococcus sp. MIT 1341 TaxID=3096221 RepID=UPI002A75C8F6|nr:type 1 glutamine amidotransferase [Prochlorococcus sp. MIT 1341]
MPRLVILQHLQREGPGLFSIIAREFGIDISVYRLDKSSQLPIISDIDSLLILGGPMSVMDRDKSKYLWIDNEINLIKQVLLKQIPFVGVCFGAQLLAYASGGNVETLITEEKRVNPEVGWSPVFPLHPQPDEPLLEYLKEPMQVLHWHEDRILLPKSASLLASSSRCREQLFRIGPNAYGLQFHAEIYGDMVEEWIREDSEFIYQAMGRDARSVLYEQQREFCLSSHRNRMDFLRGLFAQLFP